MPHSSSKSKLSYSNSRESYKFSFADWNYFYCLGYTVSDTYHWITMKTIIEYTLSIHDDYSWQLVTVWSLHTIQKVQVVHFHGWSGWNIETIFRQWAGQRRSREEVDWENAQVARGRGLISQISGNLDRGREVEREEGNKYAQNNRLNASYLEFSEQKQQGRGLLSDCECESYNQQWF